MRAVPSFDEMNSELETLLASSYLMRAPALAKLLSFVCRESMEGRGESLKEYTIAVEAFGRPESFHPKEDPIVRVQATRLRRLLRDYYRGEGRHHDVHVTLPKGRYAPHFYFAQSQSADQLAVASAQSGDVQTEAVAQPSDTAPYAASTEITDTITPVLRTKTALRKWLGVAVFTASVLLFVLWRLAIAHQERQVAADMSRSGSASQNALVSGTARSDNNEVWILAGNTTEHYIDQLGRAWSGDRYFRDGHPESTAYEPMIRAEDRNLWRHYRVGERFEYEIPLKPGIYELHLFFSEPVFGVDVIAGGGEAARIFDVSANGRPLLQEFDILRQAGGPRTTDEEVFTDISPAADGLLHLRFVARSSEALVNAIVVKPGVARRMLPIRITTHTTQFFSSKRQLWEPDRYYSGGRYHPLQGQVTGTNDPDLYSTERFGNFSYTIPASPGTYTVIFHFSEVYFGPANNGGGGVGKRTFDVYVNGVALLRDFDIYKEAGGPNRAVVKEFHGLRPNALGKFVLTFQPIHNYACVNAIEVIPE